MHHILAIPAVISKVHKVPMLALCRWCGAYANINHILLECQATNKLYDVITEKLDKEITLADRIFGTVKGIALVLWITNFAIYKAHLMATDGNISALETVLRGVVDVYHREYDCLEVLEFD